MASQGERGRTQWESVLLEVSKLCKDGRFVQLRDEARNGNEVLQLLFASNDRILSFLFHEKKYIAKKEGVLGWYTVTPRGRAYCASMS